MNRRIVDQVLIALGVVVALVLAAGSGLAWLGHNFANDQIKSQLVQEKIYFPKAGTPALNPKEFLVRRLIAALRPRPTRMNSFGCI
jgi:hypothetical protein